MGPGSTYTTRLWCIMEVFVFLKMGGSTQRVTILPIGMDDENEAMDIFDNVDVSKCKCHLEQDRQRLLNIVKQGFASFEDFNETVRCLCNERLTQSITIKQKTNRFPLHRMRETKVTQRASLYGSENDTVSRTNMQHIE